MVVLGLPVISAWDVRAEDWAVEFDSGLGFPCQCIHTDTVVTAHETCVDEHNDPVDATNWDWTLNPPSFEYEPPTLGGMESTWNMGKMPGYSGYDVKAKATVNEDSRSAESDDLHVLGVLVTDPGPPVIHIGESGVVKAQSEPGAGGTI